jgi:hypothetical protein
MRPEPPENFNIFLRLSRMKTHFEAFSNTMALLVRHKSVSQQRTRVLAPKAGEKLFLPIRME